MALELSDIWLFGFGSGVFAFGSLITLLWLCVFNRRGPRQVKFMQDQIEILDMIVNHANDGIVIQDIEARIEWSNPAYCRMVGLSADQIKGRKPQEFVLPPDVHISHQDIENFRYDLYSGSLDEFENVRNVRSDGKEFWNQLSFAVINPERGSDAKVVVICRDITEQIEREQALVDAKRAIEHQALHDPLTGLANRTALAQKLETVLEQFEETGELFAVFQIDLDKFKPINDEFGHAAGDAVLVEVARRMQLVLRDEDFVSRVGGDEFVIVCISVEKDEDALNVANRLIKEFAKPISFEGHDLSIAASIGIALAKAGTSGADELIRQADQALYDVKRRGRGSSAIFGAKDRQSAL